MAIIIRKNITEVCPQAAVTYKKKLPKHLDKINTMRYVKSDQKFYIFDGFIWQEVDLIIE
jgi:hypothetical protein